MISFILKKLNLLRVPVEVELEGLDMAEYETDFYPEHERAPEDDRRARRHAHSRPTCCCRASWRR